MAKLPGGECGTRPIVCIKTPVFKEKYEETLESNYIGKAINAEKYGEEVIGYECTDEAAQTEAGAWRLFYQNAAYTYLISDNLIDKGDTVPNLYTSAGWEEKTGADVSNIAQGLNPMFKNAGGFISSNENKNIKGVGYLTDPEQWEKYKGPDAIFAIGGPSMELFVESFNAAGEKENDGRPTLSVSATSAGYKQVYSTDANDFKTGQNHGIYRKSTIGWWWLASPADYNNHVWYVNERWLFRRRQRHKHRHRLGSPINLYPNIYFPAKICIKCSR